MIYHWSNSITYHMYLVFRWAVVNIVRSITYACITRQTPLRKLCGALASRRSIRRAWRARAESCQRPAAKPRTRRRLTELLVKRKTSSDVPSCQEHMNVQEVTSFPLGASRVTTERRDAWLPGRGPPAVGRVGGRAATSSGVRRTTGFERTPTSPMTCRDGRRCGEKSCRGNIIGMELAGVATLGG